VVGSKSAGGEADATGSAASGVAEPVEDGDGSVVGTGGVGKQPVSASAIATIAAPAAVNLWIIKVLLRFDAQTIETSTNFAPSGVDTSS